MSHRVDNFENGEASLNGFLAFYKYGELEEIHTHLADSLRSETFVTWLTSLSKDDRDLIGLLASQRLYQELFRREDELLESN